jgi:hypothetical protein
MPSEGAANAVPGHFETTLFADLVNGKSAQLKCYANTRTFCHDEMNLRSNGHEIHNIMHEFMSAR